MRLEGNVQVTASEHDTESENLHRTADVDALVAADPEVDWAELRQVSKGRRSPLAALRPKLKPEVAPAPA